MEILDLKNTMPEMKSSLEGFNSSFKVLIKRISEFKYRPIDTIQSERRMKKKEQSLSDLGKTSSIQHICTGSPKWGERRCRKQPFGKFSKFDEKLYTFRSSWNVSWINTQTCAQKQHSQSVKRQNLENQEKNNLLHTGEHQCD